MKHFFKLPIINRLQNHLVDYLTPSNISYWWGLGSLSCILLVSKILTVALFGMYFVATTELALSGVEHVTPDITQQHIMFSIKEPTIGSRIWQILEKFVVLLVCLWIMAHMFFYHCILRIHTRWMLAKMHSALKYRDHTAVLFLLGSLLLITFILYKVFGLSLFYLNIALFVALLLWVFSNIYSLVLLVSDFSYIQKALTLETIETFSMGELFFVNLISETKKALSFNTKKLSAFKKISWIFLLFHISSLWEYIKLLYSTYILNDGYVMLTEPVFEETIVSEDTYSDVIKRDRVASDLTRFLWKWYKIKILVCFINISIGSLCAYPAFFFL